MPIASLADVFMSVLLVGVLVLGYVALWAIWHFGFRGKGDDHYLETRRKRDES